MGLIGPHWVRLQDGWTVDNNPGYTKDTKTQYSNLQAATQVQWSSLGKISSVGWSQNKCAQRLAWPSLAKFGPILFCFTSFNLISSCLMYTTYWLNSKDMSNIFFFATFCTKGLFRLNTKPPFRDDFYSF